MSTLIFPQHLIHARINTLQLLHATVAEVAARYGEGREGGVVCFTDQDGRKNMLEPFGAPAKDKQEFYTFFAQEKCMRLARFFKSDILSSQTQSELRGQFGGGMRLCTSREIGAISGFSPAVDEAYFAAACTRIRWEDKEYFRKAMQISDNVPLYLEIFGMIKDVPFN